VCTARRCADAAVCNRRGFTRFSQCAQCPRFASRAHATSRWRGTRHGESSADKGGGEAAGRWTTCSAHTSHTHTHSVAHSHARAYGMGGSVTWRGWWCTWAKHRGTGAPGASGPLGQPHTTAAAATSVLLPCAPHGAPHAVYVHVYVAMCMCMCVRAVVCATVPVCVHVCSRVRQCVGHSSAPCHAHAHSSLPPPRVAGACRCDLVTLPGRGLPTHTRNAHTDPPAHPPPTR